MLLVVAIAASCPGTSSYALGLRTNNTRLAHPQALGTKTARPQ